MCSGSVKAALITGYSVCHLYRGGMSPSGLTALIEVFRLPVREPAAVGCTDSCLIGPELSWRRSARALALHPAICPDSHVVSGNLYKLARRSEGSAAT